MGNNFIDFLMDETKDFGGDFSTFSENRHLTFDSFQDAYNTAIENKRKVIVAHSGYKLHAGFVEIIGKREPRNPKYMIWHTCRIMPLVEAVRKQRVKDGIL